MRENYQFTDELADHVDRSFNFVVPEVIDDKFREDFDNQLDGFYAKMFGGKEEQFLVSKVCDSHISANGIEIPIRIYWPITEETSSLPCMMMYHGGGFITGSIKGLDYFSRYVCKNSKRIVVSVNYRLAPQFKFPAAVEDSFAALQYVYKNADELGIDKGRISVCGDSAGGNLAAVMALKGKKAGIPIDKQVLVYPAVDMTPHRNKSRERYGKGYSLDIKEEGGPVSLYVEHEEDLKSPDVSPLFAKDEDCRGIAPAFIVMAGCCPITSDCLLYADKLRANGVVVKEKIYHCMPHSFIIFNYPETFAALDDISNFLKTGEISEGGTAEAICLE